jgi:4-amino-4-deoxy-L-arabinose transferase-like glycosyltransferase
VNSLLTSKVFLNTLLGVVILLAFGLRVFNLNYNSPFLDEAIYIQVGLPSLQGQIEQTVKSSSWIGGFPLIYPFLSALFYSVGGIFLSRLFNVLLGTVSVFLIYYFTKQLLLFKEVALNHLSGIIAASIMAVLAVPIALSRLANYDALSFTLFLLGIILLHKAIFSGERFLYPASVVIFFLSFLSKYIVAIFFPFLLLIPVYLAIRSRDSNIIWGVIQYFCTPFLILMALYALLNFSSLQSFFTNQAVLENFNPSEIINIFFKYTSFAYILSFFSLIFYRDKRRFIIWILFVLSLIPLIVHLLTKNDASVGQHTFLSLIFLLPLASTFLTSVIQKFPHAGVLAVISVLVFTYFYSLPQVKSLEGFWPNTTGAAEALRQKVAPQDQILAESDDVIALALKDKLSSSDQVAGPFSFSYQDQEGLNAYTKAISDGYFNFIELESAYFSDEYITGIEEALSTNYRKIFDDGKVRVYQKQ